MADEARSANWVKVRVGLDKDPKVIAMAEKLADDPKFWAWFFKDWDGDMDGVARDSSVTCRVTECVTVTSLVRVWSVTRRDGLRSGDDVVLRFATLKTIDRISEVPGFGAAMASVGWAVVAGVDSIIFPKLFRHITSPDERKRDLARERQRRRRAAAGENQRDELRDESRSCHADVTPREEKRREENKTVASQQAAPAAAGESEPPKKPPPKNPKSAAFDPPAALDTPEARAAWARWLGYLAEKGKRYPSTVAKHGEIVAAMGAARAAAAIDHSITRGWNEPIEPRADDARAPPGRGTFEEQLARVKGRIDAEANGGGGP